MKKLIIANCILAIAVIFSFCAKPDLTEELSSVNTDNLSADRGGPGGPGGGPGGPGGPVICNLVNLPSNTAVLTFCGTNTNAINCVSCPPGTPAQGVEIFPGGFVNLNLQTPITFSISSNILTAVNLNGAPPVQIDAGGCVKFTMDENCVVTPVK